MHNPRRSIKLTSLALLAASALTACPDSATQVEIDATNTPDLAGNEPDASGVDLGTPDLGTPDGTVGSCDLKPFTDFCACGQNSDCASGFCIPSRDGGSVCSSACTDTCPTGFECSLVRLPDVEPTYLCVQRNLNLCRPCTADAQCQTGPLGSTGDRCVVLGDSAGSFCGQTCSEDKDCPTDYACKEAVTLEGAVPVRQCLPAGADATCECSGRATEENATTACNDGPCTGSRSCTADGLSACTAATPAPEACDGADNDCDGVIDDGHPDTDGDLSADCVDEDRDGDGVDNGDDNCPEGINPDQADLDDDGLGDGCDDDTDGDGVLNGADNCPQVANPEQADGNADGTGDACDTEAPVAPQLGAIAPVPPSPERLPVLSGTTEVGATVQIFYDADCSGEPAASVAALDDGAFSLPVPVAANAVTALFALAVDSAGNPSDCTEVPVLYEHDDIVPGKPSLTGFTPAAPSRTTVRPTLSGTLVSADARERVRIYASADCSGPSVATVAATAGAFSTVVEALANDVTRFTALALDAAGNASDCSDALAYLHDDLAPQAPNIATAEPHSPSNATTRPLLTGYAENGTTVALYDNSGCRGTPLATTTADGGTFEATVSVPENTTTQVYASATDAAGNVSACSSAFPWTHNAVVPNAPELLGTTPTSPSRTSTTPTVAGRVTSGSGSTVTLYTTPDCSGEPAATVQTAASFSTPVPVRANSATSLSAQVRDAAGNVSACSEPLAYVHDDTAPAPPVFTGTDPVSPSRTVVTPRLLGTGEAAASLEIFRASTCAGLPAKTAVIAADGTFSVETAVAANTDAVFVARLVDAAGNVSDCSLPLTYSHDATAPARPVLTGTNPVSPSNTITQPSLLGTTEPGANIAVFAGDACASSPIATGQAGVDGAFALAVSANVNASTSFTVKAIDAAGNESACSVPLAYVHDNVPPPAPVITSSSPPSPSASATSPQLSGTTVAGTRVTLYPETSCRGTALGSVDASGATFTIAGQLAANTTRRFSARATDAAGNVSLCSVAFSFTHDSTAPAKPTLSGTSPASPSNSTTTPSLQGQAEVGTTVRVYTNPNCSGNAIAQQAENGGPFSIVVTAAANNTTTFHVTATDAAGNVSPCSLGVAFTHDAAAPAAPTLTGFSPASPSRTSTTPSLLGSVEAGVALNVFASRDCSGAPAATVAQAPASFSAPVTVAPNTATVFSASATDAAGNVSACSAAQTYIHDSLAPETPEIAAATPASPSSGSTTPTVTGVAETGTTVRFYTVSNCTGNAIASVAATDVGFTATLTAASNATTTFYVQSTDAAGNVSECSAGFPWTHDNTAPAAPAIVRTNPVSPSRASTSPTVIGTSEALSTVRVFAGANCPGTALGLGSATAGEFAIDVTVTANTKTVLSARAADAAGNISACSGPFEYVHDSLAPATPVLSSTTPASPSNNNLTPLVNGTAEVGASVAIFTNATCAEPALGQPLTVGAGGSFSLPATVGPNSSTTFYVRATDAAGNASPCSVGITYVHNNVAGSVPIITGSTPLSPSASSTTPTIAGRADPDSVIKLYANANCSGAIIGQGTAPGGLFSVQVTVPANTATSIHATATDAATNVSGCSNGFVYRHDSVKPEVPVLSSSEPVSPARSTTPTISGTAEANATIKLFSNSTCTTAVGSPVSATAAGAFAIPATVPANGSTAFYANATDAAGNVSNCSTAFTYVSDNTAPAAPALASTTPASPSNTSTTPVIAGTSEIGARLQIFASANCTGAALGTIGPILTSAFTYAATVSANTTTVFTARATDAAGNLSACSGSLSYTHDNVGPNTPSIQTASPASPSNTTTTPSLTGSADTGSSVRIYTNSTCTGAPIATGTAAAGTYTIVATAGANAVTVFYASASDAAGNASACSGGFPWTHDNTKPTAPSLTGTNPVSPSTSTTPLILGTTEANATVRLYSDATCATLVGSSVLADAAGAFSVPVTVTANTSTSFYASATDASGNVSLCSAALTFVSDGTAPGAPVFTGATPASPSGATTQPTLSGTAEAGARVQIFASRDCTGTAAVVGPIAGTTFSWVATVAANTTASWTAKAVDAAGNVSPCSGIFSWTHDATAPAVPGLVRFNPASPSKTTTTPTLSGTSENGVTVKVFTTANCTGTANATVVATATGFSVAVTATANTTTTFYANATDAANNVSGCSSGLAFRHDNTAPAAPAITASTPASPSNASTSPTLTGSAEASASVQVFAASDCSGTALATVTATGTATFSAAVTATANAVTAFTARATDLAGNVSPCSTVFNYRHDSVVPAAPSLTSTTPASPSNSVTTPTINGTAEVGASVRVYTTSNCSGTQVGNTATASGTGVVTAQMTVGQNTSTTFYATATDAAGNISPCSAGITYVHTNSPVQPPAITGSTPASPSSTSTTPSITGTAPAGLVIRLYKVANATDACPGTLQPVATASAGATGFAIQSSVTANTATLFRATATDAASNVSICSNTFTFVHDSTKPLSPSVTASVPGSPSSSTTPTVTGTAEANTTVRLFTNSNCTTALGTPVSASAGSTFSASVVVPANTTTSIYATATDAAGNVSPCSTSSLTYRHDSLAPAAPIFTGSTPTTPSNASTTPTLAGTAETGARVRIYTNGSCAGDPATTLTALPGTTFSWGATVLANSTSSFTAQAVDAADNVSPCSGVFSYTHDNGQPATPVIASTTPASPSSANLTPAFNGTAEEGATVRLFTASDCSGAALGSGAATATGFAITVTVTANTTTTVYASATDPAGNVSGCSRGLAYTHDNTVPGKPVITATNPLSPARTVNPVVTGTAEANATVTLYLTSSCTTQSGLPVTADANGAFSITSSVGICGTTNFYVAAKDAAGNVSACSDAKNYVCDQTAPQKPTISGSTPASPSSTSTTPTLNGTTEPGAVVRVYPTNNCTGTFVTVGPVANAAWSWQATVTANTTAAFSATAVDAAGNVSGCSNAFAYTHDSVAPVRPVITGSTPASPSTSATPTILGTAESGSTVSLHSDAQCGTAAIASGPATGTGFSIAVTLGTNRASNLYARSVDPAGNVSACSVVFVYTHDNTAPATPAITTSTPTSPSRTSTTPTLNGTAEANATVTVFATSDCTGTALGTTPATANNTFSFATTVLANSRNTFTVRARDAAGNDSACSPSFTYVHDATAPAAPALTSTTPTSPSNSVTTPAINGTGEVGASARLYSDATCTTALYAAVTVPAGGAFAINATVNTNSSTTFYANVTDAAGNVSPCSTGITYVHSNVAGSVPVITGSIPASPSKSSTTPSINGTADTGNTVKLYKTNNCTGTVAGSVVAANGSFSIPNSVTANTTTPFTATSTNSAGNVSTCSGVFNYTHDSTAPSAPAITASNPTSPGRSTTPTLSGTAEVGATVQLFTDSTCTTRHGSAVTATGLATFAATATVLANETRTFYANATDAAGNVSVCSVGFTYTSDNTAPGTPVWTGVTPSSPGSSATPVGAGAAEANGSVKIYSGATCSGNPIATATAQGGTFSATLQAALNVTNTYSANVTDAAGNASACSGALTYVHDDRAPGAPTLTTTEPLSPSNSSTSPFVLGTAPEAGHTVVLYKSTNCSGAESNSLAAAGTSFALRVTVAANTSTPFSAKLKDLAGNLSPCSNTIAFTNDSLVPSAPVISSSSPGSPGISQSPFLSGSAEASATVRIYRGTACAGTPTTPVAPSATVTASGAATFIASVSVAANVSTVFTATATDAAGNVSPCSGTFAYTHDGIAPNKPILRSTSPTSPSNASTTPSIAGAAPELNTVTYLYKTADCSGATAGVYSASTSTSFTFTTSVVANETTTFTAQSKDAAGNVSLCSDLLTYTHDSNAPAAPSIVGSSPVTPSKASTTPSLSGYASEVGLTAELFANNACTGTVIASGQTTSNGQGLIVFSLGGTATANAVTGFYARVKDAAGNLSGCSGVFNYTHDNVAPPSPVLRAFTPTSPSTTHTNTSVTGTEADNTSTIEVFKSTSCAGSAVNATPATVSNNNFAAPFTATQLGCTTLTARATDPATNVSTCSLPLTFNHYGCPQCRCPDTDWVRLPRTAGADLGNAVAVDAGQSVIRVGSTTGVLGTVKCAVNGAYVDGVTNCGAADVVVQKFDPTGNLEWTRQLGTSAEDLARDVTTDASKNIYVSGNTRGDIDNYGKPVADCAANPTQCSDAFVAKYDTNGNLLWTKRFVGARIEGVTDMEWDGKYGRVVLLLDSRTTGYGAASPQVFTVNASTGAMTSLWSNLQDSTNIGPGGLAVDGSGTIYVHGRSQYAISGALSTTGSGGNGVNYIYKISDIGTQIWLQHWGSAVHDMPGDIVVDTSGNIYAAGYLQGAPLGTGAVGTYLGANGLDFNGLGDAAIAKFSSGGAQQWARIFGTPLDDALMSLTLLNGNLYGVGYTRGNISAGTNVSKYGGLDFFTVTLALPLQGTVPTPSALLQFGTPTDDYVGRPYLLPIGVWYITGHSTSDWVGMSRDACDYRGDYDAFLAKLCAYAQAVPF